MTEQQTTELDPPVPIDLVDLVDDASPRDDRSSIRRRILRGGLFALPVVLVVLALGAVVGPYVYIHLIEGDPPKPLAFATTNSKIAAAPNTPASVAGAWVVVGGSTVGYRVSETLMGQGNTAVGRTTAVTGNFLITNATVRSAEFTVDVNNIKSDVSERDGSYRKIMETATFSTATFTQTKRIALTTIPANLQQITVPVNGELTLHGVTRPVTFNIKARRNGSKIELNGSIPITFSDYKIANPSLPGIKVGNHGALEFLLVFARP